MKIGLFGGSFDPIHNGHLIIAEYMRDYCKFDKFIFIPTGNAPHKRLTDAELRYDAVKAAIKGNPYFRVSRCEVDREETSYTVDTARHFRNMYPNDDIYFLIGLDTLFTLGSWKDIEEISTMFKFLVMKRELDKHVSEEHIGNVIKQLYETNGTVIELVHSPIVEISSTDIRNRIKSGNSVKYQLPDDVLAIIYDRGLYAYASQEHIERLRREIGDERLMHSIRVADIATELARVHGADEHKAAVAGMYHDCAKFADKVQMLKLCVDFGIIKSLEMSAYTPVLHQYLGRALAFERYEITDEDVLKAISCHTTGAANMSQLDKLLYLADYIEPERNFDGVQAVRELAYADLDRAMYVALSQTLAHLENINRVPEHESVEAFEYFGNLVK